MQSESSTDTAAESWTSPLEAFLQKAELRQTLRSLQLEALVFPYKPTSGFVQALSTLSTDIQAYLARIGEQEIVCSEQKSTELGASVVQNRMGREEVRQAMADAVEKQRAEINANNRDEFLLSRPEGETTSVYKEQTRGFRRDEA
ncbi:hypothetical protein GGI07_003351 [Coemansia sp. Benny D115]|nr:hypothetical protein GGI07_003351 [Coemansia sp. Benny D115]